MKKKKTARRSDESVVYQARSGALELRKDAQKQTILATQAEMGRVFDVNPQAITKHLKNIYKEKELSKKATCSNLEQVQKEGGRTVRRTVEVYNLDAIIAVGYRINSVVGTRFRQWATKTLGQYMVEGYLIDKRRIVQNYDQFIEAVATVKRLMPAGSAIDVDSVLDLVNLFADTWFSLDAYDRDALATKGVTRSQVALTAEKLKTNLKKLKSILSDRGEATEHFGAERRPGSIEGIVGNVMQSFSGKEVYETVEEKAAHILYFMVKDHPFVDGNKRSGAYAFVWFLRQAKILDTTRLTPSGLTALTLLVAQSDPKDKEKMVQLVMTLIVRGKRERTIE